MANVRVIVIAIALLTIVLSVFSVRHPLVFPFQAQPTPAIEEKSWLTMERYHKLSTGMAYMQVVGILGETGTEVSKSEMQGLQTVAYKWSNRKGANIFIIFQNDALVTKSQAGLE